MLRLLIAAAVCAVALTAAAPAPANLTPGEIGASAYTRMDAETFARDLSLQKSDFWNETNTGTEAAASTYRWPPAPPTGEVFTCPQTGCAGYDGRAMSSADISAGLLRAVATARMHIGNAPNDGYGVSGYIFSDGRATIADTITLSEPATVVLRGSVTGSMGGSADTYQQPTPDAQVLASFSFTGERDCGPLSGGECFPEHFGGFEQRYDAPILDCPTDGTCAVSPDYWESGSHRVDDSFELEVALPAGTTNFTAKLWAAVDFQVYGRPLAFSTSHAFLNFGNSAVFEIQVPDDVVATSGSGLLPLVGGSGGDPETPGDTEAPALQLPSDLTAEATGPDGAVVTYAAGATDESDPNPSVTCTPASGSTFALDTTTVSCTASDAAGNQASGAFTVRVVDTTPPVLDLGKLARTIRTYNFVGVVAAFPVEATDLVDPTPLVLCTPGVGQRLPIGETVVQCSATDDAANRAEDSVTIVVLGPMEALHELIDDVRGAVAAADGQKLLTPLERARLALTKTRVDSAEAALESFVGEVEKQAHKGRIAPSDAARLESAARNLLQGLFPVFGPLAIDKIADIVYVAASVLAENPDAQQIMRFLIEALQDSADPKDGRAVAKLRAAQDGLADLMDKGQVSREFGTAASRDISTLLAVLTGSAKDANPKG